MELLCTPWEAGVFHPHHRTLRAVKRHHFNPLRRSHPVRSAGTEELCHRSIRDPLLENMFSVHSLLKSLPGNRVLRLQQPNNSPPNRFCSRNVETDVQDGVAIARVRLPLDTIAEDVQLDLDEFSRTLTIRVQSWEQKLTLDPSLDMGCLKASFDESQNELCLRAFTSESSNAEKHHSTRDVSTDVGYMSEEERPPSECSDASSRRTPSPSIYIEDVGPEEEIDRISISSTDAD